MTGKLVTMAKSITAFCLPPPVGGCEAEDGCGTLLSRKGQSVNSYLILHPHNLPENYFER